MDIKYNYNIELKLVTVFGDEKNSQGSNANLANQRFRNVFRFLCYYGVYCSNFRGRFFEFDYVVSAQFLRFCVVTFWDSWVLLSDQNLKNELLALVSEPQFTCLLAKYISYSTNCSFSGFNRCSKSSPRSFWVDEEFDWLIKIFLLSFCKANTKLVAPTSISKFEWWKFFNVKRNQLYVVSSTLKLSLFPIFFDFGQKFSNNSSMFQNWKVQKSSEYQFRNVSVNSRFMFSFQTQFNYSDIPALDFHVSNFRQIHLFNPIFKEMQDLPFLLSSLRPGFNNQSVMHIYNSAGKLHYVAVYPIVGGVFVKFIFDRYLYDHARLLISLPDRYLSFVEAQYFVNFGALNRSSYFFCYSNYIVNRFVICRFKFLSQLFCTITVTKFSSLEQYKFRFSSFYARQKFISQILLNCWNSFFCLRKWFENVNYFFFKTFFGTPITDLFGNHDLVRVFFGTLDHINFDRLTRRVLLGFSKLLYTTSYLGILFSLKFSEDQLCWANSFSRMTSTFNMPYDNVLSELEIGYRNQKFNLMGNRRHFSSLGFSSFEQFQDYELWLYVFFHSWFNLFNELY